MTGSESLIGKTGVVLSDLAPEGIISVEGIIWKARRADTASDRIEKGSRITVVRRIRSHAGG